MPGLINVNNLASAVGVADGGTAETVILTIPHISTSNAQTKVQISGGVEVTLGASQTSATVKVRRGATTAGTQVGTSVSAHGTAAAPISIGVDVEDTPGDVSDMSYCFTVTEAGGAGNGTVDFTSATVTIHS